MRVLLACFEGIVAAATVTRASIAAAARGATASNTFGCEVDFHLPETQWRGGGGGWSGIEISI